MKKILNTITILLLLVSAGIFAQPHKVVTPLTIAELATGANVQLPANTWINCVSGDLNIGAYNTNTPTNSNPTGQINIFAQNGVYVPSLAGFGNGHLTVDGTVLCSRVKIAAQTYNAQGIATGPNWNWADYVFTKEYVLKPLDQVATFIDKNKHLEGMPTTNDVKKDGLDMAPITAKLLEKIEELTLYVIEHNKKIEELILKNELQAKENQKLATEIEALKQIK